MAGVINPGSDGFQKLFFGQEEIAVPVHGRFGFNSHETDQFCSRTALPLPLFSAVRSLLPMLADKDISEIASCV